MKTSRIPGKAATVIKTGVVAPDPHGSASFWEPGFEYASSKNQDPDPHRSDKLDPEPHQLAYGKSKCMEYEPF